MKFHERVSIACVARRIRHPDLCRLLDGVVGKSSVHRYLNGSRTPDIVVASKFATILQVTIDWLAGLGPDEVPCWQSVGEPYSDEIVILDVVKALRLTKDEAIRRLACNTPEASQP